MIHKTINQLVSIVLPGEIVPAPRPRFARNSGRTYMPQKYRDWQNSVLDHARKQAPSEPSRELFEIQLLFLFRRPKSKTNKKNRDLRTFRTGRGDLDNCIKSALDLLQMAGVIHDDRQCVKISAEQWFCAADESPRVDIHISTIKKGLWSPKP